MPTSANVVVVPCKGTQHVGPNNVACCWPTMLRPFAWALSGGSSRKYFPGLLQFMELFIRTIALVVSSKILNIDSNLKRLIHTCYAMLSRGIPWNMPRVICILSKFSKSPKSKSSEKLPKFSELFGNFLELPKSSETLLNRF